MLDNGSYLVSKHTELDEYGTYLPMPVMGKKGPKLFICICNDCGHKWYGGAFTWRCPKKDCQSTNFRTVPDGW